MPEIGYVTQREVAENTEYRIQNTEFSDVM